MSEELVTLFSSIGLNSQQATETAKNKKIAPSLEAAIKAANLELGCDRTVGQALYTLASSVTPDAKPHLSYIAIRVANGDLKSSEQISAAIKFVEKKESIDDKAFNEACGVGITVTSTQVSAAVSAYLEANKANILELRYKALGPSLAACRKLPELRWADGGAVKEEVEKQFIALVGPKDERDEPPKKKKPTPTTEVKPSSVSEASTNIIIPLTDMFKDGDIARLHKPGENPQIKPELMEKHLKATGGKVVTRFPPEPNGYLHIGHAKAINVNFGYAQAHNGICYLRYDDTNPEAEEERYFISILKTIEWLGFKPHAITYSSDYFQILYELAIDLIKRDKAYACHCTGEEIHAHRGGDEGGPRTACKHRNRPINESLEEFEKMKEGRYKEGETVLRMKMNLEDGNPQFWDLIAYRVLYTPHHRTKDQWCIYPTYDYTHCLCDSFENITHSLCTLEFRQSRPSYYWLCDALEVYKPVQWEYGRLSVTNSIMSKRKLKKLVDESYINGWDDPRMFTLDGLRRRGIPPEAINNFVRELGITTNSSTIDVARLDYHTRNRLDATAPRLMVVLEPLKVTISNLPEDYVEEIVLPNKPRDPSMGEHVVPFTNTIFIERSDFREVDSPDYFRLAPGKSVGLLFVKYPITVTSVKKDSTGNVTELICKYMNESETFKKPKTYIHWIANSSKHSSPVQLDEVRIYDQFFMHANPSDKQAVPGGYLTDINPESLKIVTTAIAEVGIWDHLTKWAKDTAAKDFESMRWQFVRTGYFCIDKDSVIEGEVTKAGIIKNAVKKLVINRIVTLKEDTGKDSDGNKKDVKT